MSNLPQVPLKDVKPSSFHTAIIPIPCIPMEWKHFLSLLELPGCLGKPTWYFSLLKGQLSTLSSGSVPLTNVGKLGWVSHYTDTNRERIPDSLWQQIPRSPILSQKRRPSSFVVRGSRSSTTNPFLLGPHTKGGFSRAHANLIFS